MDRYVLDWDLMPLNFRDPLPPIWSGLWALLLAMAWLLPNHYFPWATFHADAWVSVMVAVAAGAVILRSPTRVAWHSITVMVAVLATVPFLQFGAGMLPYSGQAWVSTAYVLGLLLALLVGAHWEEVAPRRAADALFLAIGIAGFVSVAMQLRQWLGLAGDGSEMQVWTAEFTPGRPSANLGQPNQLATLLLWSVLACVWGVLRKQVRVGLAVLAVLFLLFGVVLTQSRIASIGVFGMLVAAWAWRRFLPPRGAWLVTLLFVYFAVCTLFLQQLSDFFGLEVQIRSASLGGASTQLRIKAYSLFLDAVFQRPWLGYGWDQLAVAQLAVAQNHGTLTSFFFAFAQFVSGSGFVEWLAGGWRGFGRFVVVAAACHLVR
jgi:hypothetical protein